MYYQGKMYVFCRDFGVCVYVEEVCCIDQVMVQFVCFGFGCEIEIVMKYEIVWYGYFDINFGIGVEIGD